MRHGLRPWKSLFAAGLLAALGAPAARAQTCPAAATCTPGKASAAAATGTAAAGGVHAAAFAPPATARTGVALRLRVAADHTNSPVPTPCSTPQFSQDEDYAVTLAASTGPPVAAFATNGATTCSGCVQFADASQNLPTAWAWAWIFGDGTTSAAQSPSRCYAAAGTYQVRE